MFWSERQRPVSLSRPVSMACTRSLFSGGFNLWSWRTLRGKKVSRVSSRRGAYIQGEPTLFDQRVERALVLFVLRVAPAHHRLDERRTGSAPSALDKEVGHRRRERVRFLLHVVLALSPLAQKRFVCVFVPGRRSSGCVVKATVSSSPTREEWKIAHRYDMEHREMASSVRRV